MDDLVLFMLNAGWQIAALALVALGLGLVFGLLKIMNMAHGEFFMLGAYSMVLVRLWGLPPFLAVPLCLGMVGGVAFLVERLVVRHFYARMFDSLLATWAVSILLREAAELAFGRQFRNVPMPVEGVTDILGVGYPTYRLFLIALIGSGSVALWLWYKRSATGLRLRAMVDNPALARGTGINTARMSSIAFIVGCQLSGLAGLMLAPTLSIDPAMGLDALIRSFFVLVVGGLGTLEGLAVGAITNGGVQAGLSEVFNQTAGYLGVLVLAVIFLWRRPDGIYRRK
jgi:branched-subunit amino acid ABC-type transport system permease component